MRPGEWHLRPGDHIIRDKPRHGKVGPSEWHSRTEDPIGRDNSVHGNNAIEQGALTHWIQHRRGQVRIRKEYDQESGTHALETAS